MYYPIVNPVPQTSIRDVLASESNQLGNYQLFDALTELTEKVLGLNPKGNTSVPGADDLRNVPYYQQNSIALPAVGSGFLPIVQFTVPLGYNGVIKKIQNNITGGGFVDGSGDIIWQIVADDIPIKNFESMLTERGTPNSPTDVSGINIYSGQTISYLINHVANPTLAGYGIAGLVGYFYPQQ